ncbi:MAG: ATP-binding cassette domain-containing protein [Bacteroidales bacterium]|nr:ATP-binding cassette domain-containing protein [Bacteroidales bacterium]MBN2698697.1 ATP-binding cassette domain-containing protein [Bacteroidales bacterium]
MSEEILKALMQLFAIIIKQDGGIEEKEKEYVRNFLNQQIGVESSEAYFRLFLETASGDHPEEISGENRLTSVLDSVKILRLCRQINTTLNQRQKIVVLVRILELINSEYKLTKQRLEIVDTVAEVFRVSRLEYDTIFTFVTSEAGAGLSDMNLLLIRDKDTEEMSFRHFRAPGMRGEMMVLRVPSVELYFIKYLGTQEIFLNGLALRSGVIYLLANGSTIRITGGQPFFYSDIRSRFHAGTSIQKITFEADHITFTFPNGYKGLHDISFFAEQGNLIGILGSSGSGKTTLLNVLSGIYVPDSGSIRINNLDVRKDPGLITGTTGYVPQDDLLIEELSVFDNLYFNARFCFRDRSDSAIRKNVEDTLSSLGLLDKKDLRVGSVLNKTISGGQRKRLNIALELIREPSVLYLDEPTSGLSSKDSENVMDLLRELALKGKLIFVVIHQPSSELYKMFDKVLILDTGGRLVYFGNPVEGIMHFKKVDNQVNADVGECPVCGNVNPELIFNIIEARQVDEFGNYTDQRKMSPKKWEEVYRETKSQEQPEPTDEAPPVNLNIPGWFSQLANYFRRDFKSKMNNRQYVLLNLLVSPVLAFILSYIIRYIADPTSRSYIFRENENIPIYIFMALIVALFLGLIISAEEIFRDRKILKREKFLNLSRSSYLIAKIFTLVIISAIQAFTFVIIANSILEIRNMLFPYWFALFSTAVCANLIGLIISSSFNSAVTIYIIIPLVMIPMMVLSGAMFSFEKLNRRLTRVDKVPLIAELMPTKWSYEALMVKQFKDNEFQRNFYEVEKKISQNNFMTAYFIPELKERLDACRTEYNLKGALNETLPAFEVLKNEIWRHRELVQDVSFKAGELDPSHFNAKQAEKTEKFLDNLNRVFLQRFSKADREKQHHLNTLFSDDRRALYFTMLDRYHNESVSDQVQKIYEKNKIVEYRGRLYRQIDPVFHDPEPSGLGIRAHFFAPRKYFLGRYHDTFNFNMGFIWFMTGLLYIVLYYDVIARIINHPVFKKRQVVEND